MIHYSFSYSGARILFKIALLILLFVFQSCEINSNDVINKASPSAQIADVAIYIDRISDFSIAEQQYSIDFWLSINYTDTLIHAKRIDFLNQLEIKSAKQSKITFVDSSRILNRVKLELKVECLMQEKWDLQGYPFDKQQLNLDIYNPVFDTSELYLKASDSLRLRDSTELENGWGVSDKKIISKSETLFHDPARDNHSIISGEIFIFRKAKFILFAELFFGMYIAFFVAFLALFIKVKHVEPRFGLPVGGLFAVIANKYVIDNIFPQIPGFNIVDFLHIITGFLILLIIAISTWELRMQDEINGMADKNLPFQKQTLIHLNKRKHSLDKWIPVWIIGFYFIINVLLVLWASMHED